MLAKKLATYDDLLALPEHVVGEIVDGELIVSPRPAIRHAQAASALGVELGSPFARGRGGPGGWVLLFEPELHVAGQVLVPDLAGWRRARLPQLPDGAFFELAPDWVCEVLSPATAAFDRSRKLAHYAEARVQHAWLVDPTIETLEVLRLDGDGWRIAGTFAGGAPVRAEPFEAVELELAALWAR